MKQKLIEELLELLNNMRGAESGSNHIGFVSLKDGRTAEVVITVNTDEDDFIADPEKEKVFILKNKQLTEFDLP